MLETTSRVLKNSGFWWSFAVRGQSMGFPPVMAALR